MLFRSLPGIMRFRERTSEIPVLRLVGPRDLIGARYARTLAVPEVHDVHALKALVDQTAVEGFWVDRLFGELTLTSGESLPRGFRGFARRILEYPGKYVDLHSVAGLTGLSREQ